MDGGRGGGCGVVNVSFVQHGTAGEMVVFVKMKQGLGEMAGARLSGCLKKADGKGMGVKKPAPAGFRILESLNDGI